MTRLTTSLAFLLLAVPAVNLAQNDTKPAVHGPHCGIDHGQHDNLSVEERQRLAAERRMLEEQARRARAETRLMNAQRSAIHAERRRIQAERIATLSEAKQREWAHRSADVAVDLLTANAGRYHTVVLTSVTGLNTKESVRQIYDALHGNASIAFVNPLKVKRKYRTHRKLPTGYAQTTGVLRMQFHRERLNEFGRFVRMTLVDHTGKVVYEARYENMHYGEMLAPVQGISAL